MKKLNALIDDVLIDDEEGVIVVGVPFKDDDTVHNCDQAGCSSYIHVLFRNGKPTCEMKEMEIVD